jgi:membrane protein implicated in regulation of membrane protease activity
MASIPGWIYIIIGVAIAIYSKLLVKETGANPFLNIFFYIGVAFIAVGLVKTIFKRSKKDKPVNEPHTPVQQKQTQQQKPVVQQQTQNTPGIVYCNRCGAKHYSNSNFCHLCGSRLPK